MAGATIVFCDIVGFSKLNNNDQGDLLYSLNADVTHELYRHLAGLGPVPSVIGLPTGDGMAIALLDQDQDGKSHWAPVLFSLLDRLMRWAEQKRKLRVGVHCGRVSLITDINRRPNVCGATVNVCQRIMDSAHANQVLFSKDAYEQYVGSGQSRYVSHPFSEEAPAQFKGPINIIVKHGESVPVFIMHKNNDGPTWIALEPYPRGTIVGKVLRTQVIVNRLESLLESKQQELLIYEQSAFSTFGISRDQTAWRTSPEYSDEYLRLVLRQRDLLDRLAREPRTTLKLIINPERGHDFQRIRARLDTLLEWMIDPGIKSNPNIQFVEAPYDGPNRIIVANKLCIEGFKLHDTMGYEFSILQTDEQTIADAMDAFERVFLQARSEGSTNQSVIESLQRRRATHSPDSDPKRTEKAERSKRK